MILLYFFGIIVIILIIILSTLTGGIIINEGWLILSNGTDTLKLYFEGCKVSLKMKPNINHFTGQGHFGFDMQKWYLEFKVQKIYGTSHANFSSIIDYLTDWQSLGSFNLQIYRDTSSNMIEWDGDHTTFPVMLKTGLNDMEKIAPRDGVIYVIGNVIFEQAGDAS